MTAIPMDFLFKFTILYLLGITGTPFVGFHTTTSFCDRVSWQCLNHSHVLLLFYITLLFIYKYVGTLHQGLWYEVMIHSDYLALLLKYVYTRK